MDLGIAGKRALVVGASGSIGAAVVRALTGEGAQVVASGRDSSRLASAIGEERGDLAGTVAIDLQDESSVEAGVAAAERLLGGLDILVTSVVSAIPFGAQSVGVREHWQDAVGVKLSGTAHLCSLSADGMARRGGGVIVTLIGVASDLVVPDNPIGSACNAALKHLTRTLAAQHARTGVRVVGVSPGMVAGPRADRFTAAGGESLAQLLPLQRLAAPEEIASVITFVASPAASYLTGETIAVDGGMSLLGVGVLRHGEVLDARGDSAPRAS